MNRSPEALQAAVAVLDVEHNPKYQPGPIGTFNTPTVGPPPIATWCNVYLHDLLAELGLVIPPGLLAHYQIYLLDSAAGRSMGWNEATTERAAVHVEHGLPVVAGWVNPAGHSHVALLVPSPTVPTALYVTAAGAHCYACAPIAKSFGNNLVRFHFHD